MTRQPIEQLLVDLTAARDALDTVRNDALVATHEDYPNKPALERAAQTSDDAHHLVVEAIEQIRTLLDEMKEDTDE